MAESPSQRMEGGWEGLFRSKRCDWIKFLTDIISEILSAFRRGTINFPGKFIEFARRTLFNGENIIWEYCAHPAMDIAAILTLKCEYGKSRLQQYDLTFLGFWLYSFFAKEPNSYYIIST